MSMWRCPHCGTPQAETARCWVCHRSSTTCSTCRHFRRGVAAQLGYCGLDRRRLPLAGIELRGCWEAGAPKAPEPIVVGTLAERARPSSRLRDFVPVERHRDRPIVDVIEVAGRSDPVRADSTPVVAVVALAADASPRGLTLFGDPDS